jgi:hypothetical protein
MGAPHLLQCLTGDPPRNPARREGRVYTSGVHPFESLSKEGDWGMGNRGVVGPVLGRAGSVDRRS